MKAEHSAILQDSAIDILLGFASCKILQNRSPRNHKNCSMQNSVIYLELAELAGPQDIPISVCQVNISVYTPVCWSFAAPQKFEKSH
jgi:hypothetical protein